MQAAWLCQPVIIERSSSASMEGLWQGGGLPQPLVKVVIVVAGSLCLTSNVGVDATLR